MLEYL